MTAQASGLASRLLTYPQHFLLHPLPREVHQDVSNGSSVAGSLPVLNSMLCLMHFHYCSEMLRWVGLDDRTLVVGLTVQRAERHWKIEMRTTFLCYTATKPLKFSFSCAQNFGLFSLFLAQRRRSSKIQFSIQHLFGLSSCTMMMSR